jgi:hypothetical protein
MYEYLIKNINDIFNDINELNNIYPAGNYYTRCFEIEDYYINYMRITNHLEYYYNVYYEEKYYYESDDDFSHKFSECEENNSNTIVENESEKLEENINCNICFDTKQTLTDIIIKLSCNHLFHINCIKQNLLNNEDVCPMCRKELTMCDKLIIETDNKLTINPLTKRKIKINGKTYKYLLNKGVF